MDRSYKSEIPATIARLVALRREFARRATNTDWVKLRIEPLLAHARRLERVIESPRFARESSRLRRGVRMFRSDLLYLRENVRALKAVLEAAPKR